MIIQDHTILRGICRVLSIPTILITLAYILFVSPLVSPQILLSGGKNPAALTVHLVLLILWGIGLVTAWKVETLGTIIAAASLAGFFILLLFYPGMKYMAGYSLLIGPINLFNALTESHGTDPNQVSYGTLIVSWVLTAPFWLFLTSWLLQKKSTKMSMLDKVAGEDSRESAALTTDTAISDMTAPEPDA